MPDAAYIVPPHGGQGLNSGIQDEVSSVTILPFLVRTVQSGVEISPGCKRHLAHSFAENVR